MEKKRIVSHVDSDGELHDGVLAIILKKYHNGFHGGWLAMAQAALMALAKSNLSGEDLKVLFSLLAILDQENWIQLNQVRLAEEIGIKKTNFNRALRKIERENIILNGPKVGKSLTYRLNPNYGWKGSAKNHKKALKERMERSNISSVISSENENKLDV